ncbi:MAG: chemotaxis protein CheD [Planctomycetaceae bacterium]
MPAPIPALRMGELAVCQKGDSLRTLLGSCLGVVLYDRRLKLGGLAHVVLPCGSGNAELPGKYANTAIPELLRRMRLLAKGETLRPVAKLVGGANMFNSSGSSATIGEQNIQAVEKLLEEQKIPVVARHVGGEQGRRMLLDSATGLVTVEIAGLDPTVL